MRTTIDLPEDLHTLTRSLARSRGQTLSETISEILRQVLIPRRRVGVTRDEQTGLPLVWIGRTITNEDVAALEEEELDDLARFVNEG